MAFMNQERKAERAPAIKAILKKYGVKGSIAVRHHSSLVVNLKEGKLDLVGAANRYNEYYAESRGTTSHEVNGYFQMNPYHDADNMERIREMDIANFINELTAAMYGDDYFNESDAQTDYFHVSHYIDINVGQWNKPYVLNK